MEFNISGFCWKQGWTVIYPLAQTGKKKFFVAARIIDCVYVLLSTFFLLNFNPFLSLHLASGWQLLVANSSWTAVSSQQQSTVYNIHNNTTMSLDGYWLTGSFKLLLLPSEALSLRDVEQGNQELPSYYPLRYYFYFTWIFVLFVLCSFSPSCKTLLSFFRLLVFSRSLKTSSEIWCYSKIKMADVRDKKNFSGKKNSSLPRQRKRGWV